MTRVFPSAPSHLRPRSSWLLALAVALGAASGGLAQETATIEKGGGTLAITFAGPTTPEFRQLTLDWISRAAQAVKAGRMSAAEESRIDKKADKVLKG